MKQDFLINNLVVVIEPISTFNVGDIVITKRVRQNRFSVGEEVFTYDDMLVHFKPLNSFILESLNNVFTKEGLFRYITDADDVRIKTKLEGFDILITLPKTPNKVDEVYNILNNYFKSKIKTFKPEKFTKQISIIKR